MSLPNTQIKFLRGLCHALKPIIMIGHKGLTNEVLNELNIALDHHELVKIKIAMDDREARHALVASICEQSHSERIQEIGKTVSVYRQNAEKAVISLPAK